MTMNGMLMTMNGMLMTMNGMLMTMNGMLMTMNKAGENWRERKFISGEKDGRGGEYHLLSQSNKWNSYPFFDKQKNNSMNRAHLPHSAVSRYHATRERERDLI